MASGQSNVSRSSAVGKSARHARYFARQWVLVFGDGLLTAPLALTNRSPDGRRRPAVAECARSGDRRTTEARNLVGPFDEGNFFGREFIHELVNLTKS